MKKLRVTGIATAALLATLMSFSVAVPTNAQSGYSNTYHQERNRSWNNNWRQHHDYNRYDRDQATRHFHNRYPNAHVRYVTTYRHGHHVVYRFYCDHNRYMDFDSYFGSWSGNYYTRH